MVVVVLVNVDWFLWYLFGGLLAIVIWTDRDLSKPWYVSLPLEAALTVLGLVVLLVVFLIAEIVSAAVWAVFYILLAIFIVAAVVALAVDLVRWARRRGE
jgi:hypothetical protein